MHWHPQQWLALSVVVIAGIAAVSDYRTGLIPNWLIAAGFALVLGLRAVQGDGSQLALFGLGTLIAGMIPLALYVCRALGAGDVKLMAVCGAGLGPVAGLEAELYAFGFGAMYALGLAAYGGELWQTMRGSAVLLTNPFIPRRLRKQVPVPARRTMRFGPAICAGVIAAVFLNWVPR
jgi:prepilin peptidase CpaA